MIDPEKPDYVDYLTDKLVTTIEANTKDTPFVGGTVDTLIVCSVVEILEKLISASSRDDEEDFRARLNFISDSVLCLAGIISTEVYAILVDEFHDGKKRRAKVKEDGEDDE